MKHLRLILTLIGAAAAAMVALAVFERFVPRRVLRFYQKNIGGPLFRGAAGLVPGWAVVETTGRRTGRPHRVAVGGRLSGDTYWLLGAGDAHYVRNIEANGNVRVRLHGRWRDGTAQVCPNDDARRRLLSLNPVNGVFLWLAGAELVPIRIGIKT